MPIITSRMVLPSLGDVLPMLGQARAQFGRRSLAGSVARSNGDIDGRESVLVQAEGFSRQALDAVTGYSAGAGTRCNREAKTRMIFIVTQYRQTEVRVVEFSAALPDLSEFGRLMQSFARLELMFTDRWTAFKARIQGQRRFRPFARRRASKRRPLLVAIRARKPWVRARWRLLGLKVRFMARLGQNAGGKGTQGGGDVSIDAPASWS